MIITISVLIIVSIVMAIHVSGFLYYLINTQSPTFTTSVRTHIEVYTGITIFKITKEAIVIPEATYEETLFEKIGVSRVPYILLFGVSIPTILLLLRNNRRRVYSVSVNVKVDKEKKDVTHESKPYNNPKRLVKVIIDVDLTNSNTLYKVLKKLCNMGYRFILENKTLSKTFVNEIVDKLSIEKCVINKYVEESIQEVPYVKLSELLNIYSTLEENEHKQLNISYVSKSNELTSVMERFMNSDDELYYKLKKGLYEQEMKNLPKEYKILIEELRREGIVYKDRNGVYKIVE